MKTLLSLLLVVLLASCGSNHYSPLDNYINAVNEGAKLNDSSRIAAQQYVDSVKASIIVIHNKY